VQTAIQQIDTAKMPLAGGNFTGSVTMAGGTAINLGAGSSTVPPIKFSAATPISTPSAGAIEFNGTNMFYTDGANTRKTFASTSYVDTAISTGFSSGSISAGTLTGTIPSAVLGNSTLYVGTTAIALNRASANLALTGITSIDGSAASAGTAGKFAAKVKINGVDFDGSADITVTAAAGTLSGTVLKSTVVTSSLTSVGTLGSLDVTNNINTGTIGVGGVLIVPASGIGSQGNISTQGAITAAGDITAFSSDRRLKENFRPITNAVEKVVSLNGVVYNWNSIANELAGYDRTVDVVGLIAQELEAVLPEAVKLAPFDADADGNSKSGENYKTIQYEKVVPLLVEAIKEQQTTIERQQAQIDMLISKLGA
jgi:hypothetical protein